MKSIDSVLHGRATSRKPAMDALLRFSVAILAGLEALLTALGHPDWAVALWSTATAAAQASRMAAREPAR